MSRVPRHHPSEDMLLRHAAGRLPAVQSLVVATHLPFCAACRAAIRFGETLGGALLADMPDTELTADVLTRALMRLDMPARAAAADMEGAELAPGVPWPEALRGFSRRPWRWAAPGISLIALDVPGMARRELAYLLRVAPGKSLPEHGHDGWELTCVLSGRFIDATGEYGPGDLAVMDTDKDHQPVTASGDDCICLIACAAPLRMRGLLARLIQPLTGV